MNRLNGRAASSHVNDSFLNVERLTQYFAQPPQRAFLLLHTTPQDRRELCASPNVEHSFQESNRDGLPLAFATVERAEPVHLFDAIDEHALLI